MLLKPLHILGAASLLLSGIVLVTLSGKEQAKGIQGNAGQSASTEQSRSGEPFVRFTATTENVVDAQDSIRIDLIRWSTDAERNQLPAVWNQALARAAAVKLAAATPHSADHAESKPSAAPAAPARGAAPLSHSAPLTPRGSLYAALQKMPTVGYLWSSAELSGYSIKYAVDVPEPDGGQRVILITDRKLGDYDGRWNFVQTGAARQPSTTGDYSTESDGSPNQYDEYSVIELHLNAKGVGEGKISRDYNVAIDNATKVLDLPDYGDLPVVLRNVQERKPSVTGKV